MEVDPTLFRWALGSATSVILALIAVIFSTDRKNAKEDRQRIDESIIESSTQLAKTISLRLDHIHERLDEFEREQNTLRDVRHQDRDLLAKLVPTIELLSNEYRELLMRVTKERDEKAGHLSTMNQINSELKSFIREKVK